MKYSALAAVAVLTLSSGPAMAGDPSGLWVTEKLENGAWADVTIAPCGTQMCGVVTNVYGGGDQSRVGKQVVKGMNKYGDNRWDDGEIYAADEEKWYDSKMELISETQLSVSGCVAFGIICRSQTWTKAQ